MMASEKRVQEVLDALLPMRVGARVRVLPCVHGVAPGSISADLDCAGLYPWMVGATGVISMCSATHMSRGAVWMVEFDFPHGMDSLIHKWWMGRHQIELL